MVETREVQADPKTVWFVVPRHIREQIQPGSMFKPEWTADGILYRFVGTDPRAVRR